MLGEEARGLHNFFLHNESNRGANINGAGVTIYGPNLNLVKVRGAFNAFNRSCNRINYTVQTVALTNVNHLLLLSLFVPASPSPSPLLRTRGGVVAKKRTERTRI